MSVMFYSIPQFLWTEIKNTTNQYQTIKCFKLCTDQGLAVKFKFLMALTMKTAIPWDATPRTLVQRCQQFEKKKCWRVSQKQEIHSLYQSYFYSFLTYSSLKIRVEHLSRTMVIWYLPTKLRRVIFHKTNIRELAVPQNKLI